MSGSEIDRQFYSDTAPWTMDGIPKKVVEDNEHLGQTVSGTNQTVKNIEQRIKKGRGSLFKLLGPAFSYKCLLSPVLKLYLYRTWSIFLRQLSSKYGLNDPLMCLKEDPPDKSAYKEHILTK